VYKITRNAFGRGVFKIGMYVVAVLLFLLRKIFT